MDFRKVISMVFIFFSRLWDKNDTLIIPALGLLSGIFAFLLQSFVDNHFYSLQLSVYLWFLVGIFVVMVKEIRWQNANGH